MDTPCQRLPVEPAYRVFPFPRFTNLQSLGYKIVAMTYQDLHEVNQQLVLRLHQQELIATFASFALRSDVLQLVLEEACRGRCCGLTLSVGQGA